MIKSGKSYSYWLARINRKMSFHFPWVVPRISDPSVWHNGKQPIRHPASRAFSYGTYAICLTVHMLSVSLSDWLAHWLSETNECLADRLTVWLIDWFIYLKVIGDSSGLVTSTKLLTNKGNFSVLREVEAVVKIPLKFIHVITNPFDDIASIVTKQSQQGKKVLSSFDIR